MKTLYLDPLSWDLQLDSSGNIATAANPYQLAQDAASAIRTFLAECWYDNTLGVPYWEQILGHQPPIELVKAKIAKAAMTVPGVIAAKVYIASVKSRAVTGQVHITDSAGVVSASNF